MIRQKTFSDKRNANLNKLELLLGISDNTDECLLMEICYDDAIQTFLELTNRNEDQIHLKHTSIILDLTIYKYKSLKTNREIISKAGIKSISEGGVSITYNTTLTDTETIPTNIKAKINGCKLNKCVNRKSEAEMFPVIPSMYFGIINCPENGAYDFSELHEIDILGLDEVTVKSMDLEQGDEPISFGTGETYDLCVVAVPKGYRAYKYDPILGRKMPFDTILSGANGMPIKIEDRDYLIYGQAIYSDNELFFVVV